ncbi:hypothetical protein [uncultured Dialister sp.]|mgnify:CR=1 FL=1|uniref:hypothetical protein n=1 Tax=uncultured Dialister sp. TaxID=278064 RepID=UPI00261891C5|nr:hypothetical protein [uncultured Dialister sp.]
MKKSIMAGRYEKAGVPPPVPPLLAFDIKFLLRETERGTYWGKIFPDGYAGYRLLSQNPKFHIQSYLIIPIFQAFVSVIW